MSTHRLAAVASALLLLSLAAPAAAEALRFAVYGDMPYGDEDQAFLDGPASDRLAADAGIAFVINVGDLGRPESACDDAWQARQRTLWRTGFRKPVFFTPGDNDWTDCDRAKLAAPTSELGRLDALRRIHFAVPPPGVAPGWGYRAQPGQPENASWSVAGIRFATVHVVGTGNGRDEINLDDRRLALALADARDEANRAWLAEAFGAARRDGARAVVIAMQVDAFRPRRGAPAGPLESCLASAAFAPICRALVVEIAGFAGPVLVVHGDTQPACLEPVAAAGGRPLFWRLNAWGDFSNPADMAVVTVDADRPDAPFAAAGLADGRAMPGKCAY